MSDTDLTQRPKSGAAEKAHTIGRAIASIVPGGAELFSTIITPPLEKRRDAWIESIAIALKALEEKVDGFTFENLSQNEMFVTTVMHASQIALRNHQQEKLEALRNAVLNAALSRTPEEDLQLMFLSFVDTFTSWHLRILEFLNNPQGAAQERSISVIVHWGEDAAVGMRVGAGRPAQYASMASVRKVRRCRSC